ncbi:hypothetical protein MUNTM_22460 [Mycobacterium sp. MUNTM1]
MVTRTQIDHANPQAVLGMIDSWKTSAKDMLDRADTYRQAVTFPGGQSWSGVTRDSAVAMAGKDYTAIGHMRDAIDAMADSAANGINFNVIPKLNEVRAKIADAENDDFEVEDDLSVIDTEDDGGDAPDPKRTQDREAYEQDIRKLAKAWWDADQAVASQIDKDKQGLATKFTGGHVAESPEQAERDVQAALGGDKGAAARVNAVLDSITDDQKAGKAPLTPAQAAVLSQLQAQEHGMSKDALNNAERNLGDQSRMIPNSWQLMSNDRVGFPKTPLTVGAKQGSDMTKGGFGQLPGSIQQVLKSQPGGEDRLKAPWEGWTGTDYALTSATAIKTGVNDAAARVFLSSPGTGPGAADSGLVKWFEDPKVGPVELKGFSRTNGALAAVLAVPAAINDVSNEHNSVPEAITREAGGAALGIGAGALTDVGVTASAAVLADMAAGSAIGSVVPGVGTAVGLVAGAVVGGLFATGGSKLIGEAWDSIFD